MAKAYLSIKTEAETEQVIKKSRFLGYAYPCDTVERVNAILAELRKQYYDATHVCYAYAVGEQYKSNDDGEPAGTAGMPILEVMKANGITDCLVVVVRYFGGVLLGAGGLVRAYSSTTADVLQKAKIVEYADGRKLVIRVDYGDYNAVARTCENDPRFMLGDGEFAERVTATIACRSEYEEELKGTLTEITNGKVQFVSVKEELLPFDK